MHTSRSRRAPKRWAGIAAAGLAVVLAACGDDPAPAAAPQQATEPAGEPSGDTAADDGGSPGFYDERGDYGPDPAEPAGEPTAEPTDALVGVAETALGQVVVDAAGFTLYLFTPDEDGAPTCTAGCAEAWPPVLVEDGTELTAVGIDPALLSTVPHPDGGSQLRLGEWPLYRFAGDAAPGDTTGQGSGGVWFALAPDATAMM